MSSINNDKKVAHDLMYVAMDQLLASLLPRPFVGETAWQLTRFQTVCGYDIKKITAAPVQAMNVG